MRALVVRTVAYMLDYIREQAFRVSYTLSNVEICSWKAISSQQRRLHIDAVLSIILIIVDYDLY